TYEGVIPNLKRRYRETSSDRMRSWIMGFMSQRPCPSCGGLRLKPQYLAVKVGNLNISQLTAFSVDQATDFFGKLRLTKRQEKIASQVVKEIGGRLGFLKDVGLGYITLDRSAGSLSGGEAQRIRLATQIGSQLVGVLYILDEPSIGLHQRDNKRLIETLKNLRDLGNTVIVVEHDTETIESADFIVDLGPGAGVKGGYVVASGSSEEVKANPDSLTGQYLSKKMEITLPAERRRGDGRAITVVGAREHNLKNIDVDFPLGVFTCVTGVSGSGKSTLVNEILGREVSRRFYRSRDKPGRHDQITGLAHIDKVVVIDQSPIGRTPRSNPATYTGVFTPIRDLFAGLPESRMRGYKPGRFSFNVSQGRCEACEGDGIKKIEMHFLPDIYIPCEQCQGKRYNDATLEIRYKGRNIADVLDMTVDEALEFFKKIPVLERRLQILVDVGLGYIKLGQSATTLSGGEAQRIKISLELGKRATGKTLYILDEPTTGLHAHDVKKLVEVLQRLVDLGNTVLVIEHNLDVIKSCDHIIDLGPEGGDAGGRVVAFGPPEQVARKSKSHTGRYLKSLLTVK
ncbi:MAG: excinuclease ABC subunit A, partial [Candidatus Altiarchaeales archaeon]|nr:excinuclease ABC subunit A [Candidatus Altiarchaeales archaeon]